MTRCGLALLGLAIAGCATFGSRPTARLGLDCSVAEATVLIDDTLTGRCVDWSAPGKLVVPGFHRVEIRHPSYHSFFAEVTLQEGQAQVLRAELRPQLD